MSADAIITSLPFTLASMTERDRPPPSDKPRQLGKFVPVDVKPRILTTAINEDDGTAPFDLAMSVAGTFELEHDKAKRDCRAGRKSGLFIAERGGTARNRQSRNRPRRRSSTTTSKALGKSFRISLVSRHPGEKPRLLCCCRRLSICRLDHFPSKRREGDFSSPPQIAHKIAQQSG